MFALEEIMEAVRIRKGELLEDRSSVADEEKATVENKECTDTENGKEELSNQQMEVNKEIVAEESSEKGGKEGNSDIAA